MLKDECKDSVVPSGRRNKGAMQCFDEQTDLIDATPCMKIAVALFPPNSSWSSCGAGLVARRVPAA